MRKNLSRVLGAVLIYVASQAKLDSLEKDLGLSGNYYSTALAILNVGSVNH